MIHPSKVYNYFDNHFDIKRSTNGWWSLDCPICGNENKKLAVHFHYHVVKCWVCGYKSSDVSFVSKIEGISYFEAISVLQETKESKINLDYEDKGARSVHSRLKNYVDMPKGFKTILEGDGILAQRARNYLDSRGFDLRELDYEGFGYCSEQLSDDELEAGEDNFFGYIIIPFKIGGKLAYYIGRDFIGNFLRYKNPSKSKFGLGKNQLFFNGDALSINRKCYLLEGWADAKTIGDEAISSQGWSLSKEQKSILMNSTICKELILVPDGGTDQSGESFYIKALRLASELDDWGKFKIKVLDLNKLGKGKDVNEIGVEPVLKLEQETDYFDFSQAIELML